MSWVKDVYLHHARRPDERVRVGSTVELGDCAVLSHQWGGESRKELDELFVELQLHKRIAYPDTSTTPKESTISNQN